MKKHFKKMMALVIAMVMVVAMAMPAMAAGGVADGAQKTIKVDGLAAGDTVKYVKVIAWDNTNGWVRADGFTTTNLPDATFNEIIGTSTVAGKITDASATTIASAGVAMTDGGSVATGATSWEKTNMEPGLYMVQAVPTSAEVIYNPVFVAVQADGTGTVVTLPLNYADNGTAKKSEVTVDKKAKSAGDSSWQDATTEDVGDIIDYKVETTVPAYLESYTNPIFTVTDELSNGLTFAVGENDALTDITVKVGDTALTLDTDYKITTKTASKWVIEFQKSYLQSRTAATLVTVTYQAKITDDAKNVNPENNTVKIEYSRNPSDSSDHGTKEDKTTHYTFDIDAGLQGDETYTTSEIIKVGVDAAGNPVTEEKTYSNTTKHNPLQGAEFKIYTDAACTTPYTNSTITADTVFTSSDMGLLNIKGLDEGTYYLKETKAATGYMLLTDKLKFVITATYKDVPATATCNAYKVLDTYKVEVFLVNGTTGAETATGTSNYTFDNGTITKTGGVAGDVSTEVKNTKGQSLPSTGGIGTTLFYIIGAILVLGAGILLVTRRRMNAN